MVIPTIHRLEEVGSTNDVALEMARRGEPEGLVVVADHQSSGRGRRGRTWHGEPGQGIFLSALLRPNIEPEQLPQLSFVASLAVAEWLQRECMLACALKWPNDVYIADRKLVGILVELSGQAAVVGIGVNVNHRDFPDDLRDIATSILLETGVTYNAIGLAESLAVRFFEVYDRFLTQGFAELLTQWRRYMWGIGRSVEVQTENRAIVGTIRGVDESGALVVEDQSGVRHSIHAADAIKTIAA